MSIFFKCGERGVNTMDIKFKSFSRVAFLNSACSEESHLVATLYFQDGSMRDCFFSHSRGH